MNYSLNAGEWNSVFAVPTSVVDKYIKLAGADSLKLLLFLMRHGGRIFSEKELTQTLGFTREGQLEDAAQFWVQRGILKADDGSLTAACDYEQERLPEVPEAAPKPSSVKKITAANAASIYSSAEIAHRIKTDTAVEFLFNEAQMLYGHALKSSESKTVISLVDFYQLPAEVAVMLLKYCFRVGKTSPSYINTVGQNWSDDGIRTVSEADARLSAMEKQDTVEEKLRREMGMKTKLSPIQLNYIKTWTLEWSFSLEMIMLAYDITINREIKDRVFSYMNGILKNWHAAGINTTEAAKQEIESFKKNGKPADSSNTSFDMDDVMASIVKEYQNN